VGRPFCSNSYPALLLQAQQHFPFFPKLLEPVEIPGLGGKQMYDHCAEIHYHPTGGWLAFAAAFDLVRFAELIAHALGQRIQHTVTGAGTDDKVVGKIYHFLQI